MVESNEKLKYGKNIFAGKRYNDCNVLCGGAGMLFSRDVMLKIRSNARTFYKFYSRYYSKYVDVRLTRYILEILRIKPIHINQFLNDPPTVEHGTPETKIKNAVTIHHMPFLRENNARLDHRKTYNFDDIVRIFYQN